ncbi:MAG: biosynthetic-type acetolactate synthase large subunit [Roseivirga sp.]|jgi:acetolactate synthase-1/2/3 large subunit|uniref:biosynthetic-type acetolactate synthase large subunit n=1 Tax=Roseivirga sp. TaxID=1964215 RepID=UPI001B1597E0|nr:biosynthetic-type acetolactate synthase large subunit [Roseivirga sp.]MBO6495698.1 biosynthetic-type acetolactate synthase large subunit [Roseivirga sp.]
MEAVITQSVSEKVKTSGADAVLRSLVAEGVDLIFGYPGGAIMPVYDALYHYQEEIHHVLTRHEQGAIHAAQGYARASGGVGVVMATSGPGATNLITGIADAMIDSTPLVCITGQVASPLLGSDAFQETDIISISMPATKWNYQVTRAEDIPAAIAKAFYIAKSGRPGPVLLDITKDAQFNQLEFDYKKCETVRSYKPVPVVQPEAVQKAAELINQAERPFVLFGQGVILGNAEQEFKEFIEKSGIPAAWTLLGLSALPTDHPLNVGMLGMHGNYGPNKLTNECDVLIAIGMRFDDRVTGNLSKYAKQAKVVHLDIDPSEINKNVKVDAPVLGDCKESLRQLTEQIKRKSHQSWLERFRDYDEIEKSQVIEPELNPADGQMTMGEVIKEVNELTQGDAILVTDVGQHQMVACRYTQFKHSKSNITSGGLGTMGFCLPAALGAKLGAPDREVIAVIGDGGFQMTLQELGTICQTQAAVKIIILNNSFLGMVRQWQQLFFDKRYSSTELINPDFVKIAEGYGIKGKSINKREDLKSAVAEMLEYDGSYLLEVHVGKEDNVFPMVPTGASVSDVRLS